MKRSGLLQLLGLLLLFFYLVLFFAFDQQWQKPTLETCWTASDQRKSAGELALETPTADDATDKPYTAADLEQLACVIYQKAGGDACSDETRLMVGCVVLSRAEDARFPGTIGAVLTQDRQYGQYTQTGVAWPARAAKPEEQHAVARAYAIAERVLEGERVLDCSYLWQAEFPQSGDYIYQDGLYFCK